MGPLTDAAILDIFKNQILIWFILMMCSPLSLPLNKTLSHNVNDTEASQSTSALYTELSLCLRIICRATLDSSVYDTVYILEEN